MTEYESQNGPVEYANRAERETPLALDALPGQLGLIETAEMMDLRDEIDGESRSREEVFKLALEYRIKGEAAADLHPDANGQIGLIIAMGLLWRDAELPELAIGEFEDALMYAEAIGLLAVVETIDGAINRMHTPQAEH